MSGAASEPGQTLKDFLELIICELHLCMGRGYKIVRTNKLTPRLKTFSVNNFLLQKGLLQNGNYEKKMFPVVQETRTLCLSWS